MVEIIAPSALRSGSGTWNGTTWTDLDVDRIDFIVNNNVRNYEQIDGETNLNQLESSVLQIIITGHITSNSELTGTGTFEKTKNLILAAREWYVNLGAGGSGFPQIKWKNSTWDFLIQKLMVIDNFSGEDITNYQMSVVLAHT